MIFFSMPDMSAISNPEVKLPTLDMDSAQLNNISLSGIIEQFINIPEENSLNHQPVASIHLDPNSRGSENPIGYQINVTQPGQLICDNMNQYHGLEPHNNYNTMANGSQSDQKPFVRILEQPKGNSLRFRYQTEGKGAGTLQGQHSTPVMKTFPKIQIVGNSGPAVVVVSCVTHDSDQSRAHPHNLVSPASVSIIINLLLVEEAIDLFNHTFTPLTVCFKLQNFKTLFYMAIIKMLVA